MLALGFLALVLVGAILFVGWWRGPSIPRD
jgi:hypothetical protein